MYLLQFNSLLFQDRPVKKWQPSSSCGSPGTDHIIIRSSSVGWGPVRSEETRQGYLKLRTWQWNFIDHGRSGRIFVWSYPRTLPVLYIHYFTNIILLMMVMTLTKKDPDKPLWKIEQHFMTACRLLRMCLYDLKATIQRFYWSKRNSWNISSRIQIEWPPLQLRRMTVPRGGADKKNMGSCLCFWASAYFLHLPSVDFLHLPSVVFHTCSLWTVSCSTRYRDSRLTDVT